MIDKTKLRDKGNRRLTQSLFLEYKFDPKFALYTLENEDRTYKGKLYPSLKRLYLIEEDIAEYQFATKHLYDWEQWQRMLSNKWVRKEIDIWREELEILLRSKALQKVMDLSDDGNFQASKFLADKGWDRTRGRPSKEEQTKLSKVEEKILDEFEADASRVANVVNLDDKR